MKERPILFSGQMVRAILVGRKTQTRRLVKLPAGYSHQNVDLTRLQDGFPDGTRPVFGDCDCEPNAFSVRNPYGQPGDRLWVKETWGPCAGGVVFRADGDATCPDGGKWKPSIFMPRWASRITLEIVSVRVERLQDISEQDAKTEGADRVLMPERGIIHNPLDPEDELIASHKNGFQFIWECINGLDSWDANPWVWVVGFKRVEGGR